MTDGQQTVMQGTQHIQVVYVGGVAYVQGNASGLTSAMGFPATVATNYANKWIAVHSTDSLFKSIVSAVTLAGTLAQLNPTGTLTVTAPTNVAGRQAIGVKGGLPGHAATGCDRYHHAVRGGDRTPPCRSKFSGTADPGHPTRDGQGHVHQLGQGPETDHAHRRCALLVGADQVTPVPTVTGATRRRPPVPGRRDRGGGR